MDYEKYPGGIRTKRGPTLDRIRELCYLLGDPHKSAPAIHVTGTNGKGSTVRMITSLLRAASFSVGTYTSPDLHGIRERICYDNSPISEEEWVEVISLIANLESMLDKDLTRFEILTAAAFTYFADRGVAAQVIEVGLGGTWDATNVVDGSVSVVTNIGLDHVEILGDTLEKIALEKAGILKENSIAVIGRVDQEIYEIFERRSQEVSCEAIQREGEDFGILEEHQAVGGRLATIWTKRGIIEDIYIPLLGAHQSANAAVALAASEAFLGLQISREVALEAFFNLTVPGRLEIIARSPLTVVDGAHNLEGAQVLGNALAEDLAVPESIVLVVGMLEGRSPENMFEALNIESRVKKVIVCEPNSPRAQSSSILASAARKAFKTKEVFEEKDPIQAFLKSKELAEDSDLILVTGSLYVVGDVRSSANLSSL